MANRAEILHTRFDSEDGMTTLDVEVEYDDETLHHFVLQVPEGSSHKAIELAGRPKGHIFDWDSYNQLKWVDKDYKNRPSGNEERSDRSYRIEIQDWLKNKDNENYIMSEELKRILKKSNKELNSSVELVFGDELFGLDIVNDDPWALANQVGITILSDKNLLASYVDYDFQGSGDGVVVAAVFDSYDQEYYSFDTVVDKRYQSTGLGSSLIDIAMGTFQDLQEAYPGMKLKLDVVNAKFTRFLERKYGLTIQEENGGHYIMGKVAYISKPEIQLKDYLQLSKADKGREIAFGFSYLLVGFLVPKYLSDPSVLELVKSYLPDTPEDELEYVFTNDFDDINSFVEECTLRLSDSIFDAFYNEAAYNCGIMDDADAPSFLYISYEGLVKNQWLIHFTKDAYGIANNGFTQGVDDLSTLGLTTYFSDEAKKHGGYNFAYLLSDFSQYGSEGYGWKYGDECVVFRASGIEVQHHSDQEPQVIFYGNTAKDIVPLIKGEYQTGKDEYEDGWCTPENYYCSEDLEEIVQWVTENFNQYKKHLLQ